MCWNINEKQPTWITRMMRWMKTTRKVNATNEGIITYSHESLFCFLLSFVEHWPSEEEEQYQIRRNGNSDKSAQEGRKLESCCSLAKPVTCQLD